ncbi:MAG: NAD(P)-dependent alcohol dehydrogenase [Candidatus Marinimicrobia bacterium]|nr:NAD(P)-dependent alcohol dehydrogenase [Candidatus Neomarinimicrobiota bacterium]MCF7827891.1 NAD(P)-dependent alcohol dehydrogenase [Candidatus Neomarinimicrobiota bacterium]MCF7879354.1 NAD(P)-dependent alcohol dehydrogenase [Candidatus Neomarinimicrobiota bacterium]
MKAVTYSEYGSPDVLKLEEVEKPVPRDDEVLIKIHAATVTAGDCELRRFDIDPLFWIPARLFMGIRKPRKRILGQELAGEIEEAGKEVTKFRKGDRVFGPTEFTLGAHAEYIALPESSMMAQMHANMTYEEAATVPTGGLNALHFLRKANIQPGEKVLINGAGGSIGTYAIQLAKLDGAEVTAVDRQEKLDMLRSVGADHVIDYTKENSTKDGNTYDVIFDVVGTSPFSRSVRSLRPNGRYLLANLSLADMIRGFWISKTTSKNVISDLADYAMEELHHLRDLIEAGKIRAVIDRRYPLEQIPDAHRYVETGRKTGNVVITIK